MALVKNKLLARGRPCKLTGLPLVDLARIRIRKEVLEQWKCETNSNPETLGRVFAVLRKAYEEDKDGYL